MWRLKVHMGYLASPLVCVLYADVPACVYTGVPVLCAQVCLGVCRHNTLARACMQQRWYTKLSSKPGPPPEALL